MSDPKFSPTANHENASVPSPTLGYPSEPAGFFSGIPPLVCNSYPTESYMIALVYSLL